MGGEKGRGEDRRSKDGQKQGRIKSEERKEACEAMNKDERKE